MPNPTLTAGPRPAKGFSTSRAQQWILISALLTAGIYTFRRIVEPASQAQPKGGVITRLIGAGTPPPDLAHWTVSYTAAFLMLSILALGAPELAASLAAMAVLGNLLANGTTIAADLGDLGAGKPAAATGPTPQAISGQAIVGAGAAAGNAIQHVAGGRGNPTQTAVDTVGTTVNLGAGAFNPFAIGAPPS